MRMRLLLIVLLAVLAAALARPMEPCPAACRCFLSEGLKRADCHHVPEWADLRSDAQDVRILPPAAGRGARSSALHLTHFEVFPKVLKLSVTNRSLVEVIPSGFHGLRSLQVLDLSHNLLSRFNYKVFLRMPALRRLVLTGNHIVLDQGVPLLTSTSLLSLDLSHCDLVSVPKGSLEGLRNLTALSLRGNPLRLEKGHPLVRLATLAELDLSACELEAIPDGVLDGLAGLRRLYLDGNSLHTLERGVLPRGLHHLDLSGNLIREAPTAVISSLRNLTKLELSDNPITCTCSLIGFQGWLSRGLVVTERPVVCAHPPEYRGKSWTKVNELQLCRDEEKLSSNVSESSSSSSSSDESSSDDDPSAGSSTNSEDLDDDSLPPASNELYTHENYIGGHPLGAFSLPLKVKKLGDGVTPRTVSHNDISFYLADQPYDATTARSKDDQSEETTSFTTEASVESKDDREAKEDDDEAVPDDFDTDGEEDEVEEDAETFMKNPDTIAMGKSMPEKNENDSVTEKHTTDVPDDAVATEAVEVERVSDGQGTTVTVTESVTNATLHTDAHELNKDDTTTPTYPDAHESSPEETNADEHAKDHAEVQDELTNEGHTENHVEGNDDLSSKSHNVGDLDAEGLDGPYDESEKLASESHAEDHGKDHEETSGEGHEEHEIDGHEDEAGEGRINEQEGMVTEHVKSDEEGVNVDALVPTTQVNADSTTASTPTETISETETVAPVLTADSGDRSDRGLVLENSEEPSHEEEEHHESVHLDETLNVDVGAGVETHETDVPASSPVPEEPPEGAAAAAGDVETTPESAAAPVEENIVPVVATNIVGSEKEGEPVETEAKPEAEATPTDIAVPDVEGVPEQLEVDTKPELDVKIEEVIPNSTGPVTASPLPSAPEAEATPGVGSDVMNGPSTDVETVGVMGIPMEGDKLSEDLAVEKVPQSQGEDGDADAQLQKSTITYVILGCIVVTMVVLVMYALLRSKAKQADSEKGTRIRRENGDSRSHHGQPEGTEMKDMMNPLLGSGAAQTDPEQTDHGRRASLVSLELIREVEEDAGETTRLQPNGPDSAAAIPIKGASVESKPPRKTTGAAKRPNGNWNGKPAVSDGDVAPEAPQATQATPASLATPDSQTTPSSKGATAEPTTPRQQRAADQPSKVKVKAGVITTPVPRTPVLVNRVNGNGMKVNGFNRST